MFVDQVKILVRGGDGGNGCVSFRREAHVPRGGPDGGVGGKGGDVVLVAVSHQNTLLPLRYQPEHRAERGGHGGPGNRTGRDGAERTVAVPPGTSARDEVTGEPLGEVLRDGDRLVVARGGQGGRGNRSFLSNRNRAPREADPGQAGEERWLQLDLRLIADVGLLGLPNAGKSTLLSRLSAARPKVADYPFTTLSPVLGVVEADERTFVAADIPGIIEGAHEGAGLGLQFLRHVERTRVLLHVVDASGLSGREPADDLALVREEVRRYAPALLERPQLVAASKRDLAGADDPLPGLVGAAAQLDLEVVPVSAATGDGLLALKRRLLGMIAASRAATPQEEPGVRIGLYGGTFDPIHLGHLRAAETAREGLGLDLVAFLPSAVPPHRNAPPRAAADRLAMARLATSSHPRFEAWDAELRRPGPSYTVETVAALLSERPSDSFVLVVGADTWPEMTTWREPQRLLSLVEVAVVDRPGYAGPDPACPSPEPWA